MSAVYETPKLEIVLCESDVIATSGGQTPGTDTDVDVGGNGTN